MSHKRQMERIVEKCKAADPQLICMSMTDDNFAFVDIHAKRMGKSLRIMLFSDGWRLFSASGEVVASSSNGRMYECQVSAEVADEEDE